MSTINDIGIPGVGTGILHPMQKNRWRMTFAGIGGGADAQPLSMQLVKTGKPKQSFAKVELHRYNSIGYIAGKHTWDPLAFTCEADVTGTTGTVLVEQLQKQQWLVGAEGQWLGAAGEGSIYKFATYLEQLDGKEQVIERWTIEGCWLESVTWGDLDFGSGDAVTIDVSMSFDHARVTFGTYKQGQGIATGGGGA